MPHFDLQLIFVSFVLGFAQNTTTQFQCYHGENNGTKPMDLINCPSGICVTFVTPCQNYWATTCYDDSNPMGILKAFKRVKQIKPSSFLICRQSQCNNENVPITSPSQLIHKSPKSFDNLLWPNLGKEKRSNILENRIYFDSSTMKANQNLFVFLGQSKKNSKKVWIEYEIQDRKLDGLKLRLTFDLKKSIATLKKVNFPKSISGKIELNEKLIPGQIINVTLSSPDKNNYTLLINGEKIKWLPNNFKLYPHAIIYRYGGKWSRLYNGNYPNQIFPKFSNPPQSDSSKVDCDEYFLQHFTPNTKLNYTIVDFDNNSFPYYLINNDTILIPNEIKEFELRESLCPQSESHRFQFEPYLNGTNIYFNFSYFGAINKGIFTRSFFKYAQNCDGISLTNLNSYCFEIVCEKQGSRTVWHRSCFEFNIKKSLYLVEGPKSNFKC